MRDVAHFLQGLMYVRMCPCMSQGALSSCVKRRCSDISQLKARWVKDWAASWNLTSSEPGVASICEVLSSLAADNISIWQVLIGNHSAIRSVTHFSYTPTAVLYLLENCKTEVDKNALKISPSCDGIKVTNLWNEKKKKSYVDRRIISEFSFWN